MDGGVLASRFQQSKFALIGGVAETRIFGGLRFKEHRLSFEPSGERGKVMDLVKRE